MEIDFSKFSIFDTSANDIEQSGNCREEHEKKIFAGLEQEKNANELLEKLFEKSRENIKQAQLVKAEILKDLKAGEETNIILFKAVKCIAKMTNDNSFYLTAQENYRQIKSGKQKGLNISHE